MELDLFAEEPALVRKTARVYRFKAVVPCDTIKCTACGLSFYAVIGMALLCPVCGEELKIDVESATLSAGGD
jgi:hypothetical protein